MASTFDFARARPIARLEEAKTRGAKSRAEERVVEKTFSSVREDDE